MNQSSAIGFGTNAEVLNGYAQAANNLLGSISFLYENRGLFPAYIRVKTYDGTTSPSGYVDIGSPFTVVAGGATTVNYNLLSKKVGFFGSGVGGSTSVNISAIIRNPADLRGAQIDIVASSGHTGWGLDAAFSPADTFKKWGPPPDSTGTTTSGYPPVKLPGLT